MWHSTTHGKISGVFAVYLHKNDAHDLVKASKVLNIVLSKPGSLFDSWH